MNFRVGLKFRIAFCNTEINKVSQKYEETEYMAYTLSEEFSK